MKAPIELSNFLGLYWTNAIVGLAIVDIDGGIKHANPLFCNILEYSEAELQTKNFRDITHPDDVRFDSEMVSRIVAGDIGSYLMKKRYITKTGRVIWVKLRVDAGYDQDGSLELLVAQVAIVDIPANEIKIPGEGVINKYESEAKRRVIKWIIGMVAGVCLCVTGALTDNTPLITLGATLLLGSGGAAYAESKEFTTTVPKRKQV
jgi:PAS domain S-box-containing protein